MDFEPNASRAVAPQPARRLITIMVLALLVAIGVALWLVSGRSLSPTTPQDPFAETPSSELANRLLRASVLLRSPASTEAAGGFLVAGPKPLVVTIGSLAGSDVLAMLVGKASTGKGRVIHRDGRRGLALVELERIPAGASPLPLGDADSSLRGPLHALTSAPDREEPHRQPVTGRVGQIIQRPHECHDENKTLIPWIVMMRPGTPFDLPGSPVLNEAGDLMAVVGIRDANARLITKLIAVNEVRACLAEFHER